MSTAVEPPRAPEAPPPPAGKPRLWKRWWFWVGVVVVLGIVGLVNGGGQPTPAPLPAAASTPVTQTSVAASPTAAQTSAVATTAAPTTAAPKPPVTSSLPNSAALMKYVAEAAGFPTMKAACAGGLGWMCNTQWAKASSLYIVEVRLSKLNDPVDPDIPNDLLDPGDRVARNWFNFLSAIKEDSPMPELEMVQVTTAQDGQVGVYGSAPGRESQAPAPAARITVPNGVGLNYQEAQDIWRAAGLHVAPAEDATGAGRIPVIDSNWVVLSQDPAAGAKVESGSLITATVKKLTDP